VPQSGLRMRRGMGPLEVESDAEFVEESAEAGRFAFVGDVVAVAGNLVVIAVDVVTAVVF
jgi:predicted acyltransferase (DUF342 family)